MYEYMIVSVGFDGTCFKAGSPGEAYVDLGSLNDLVAQQGWEIDKVLDWQSSRVAGGMHKQASGFFLLRKGLAYDPNVDMTVGTTDMIKRW